MHWWCTTSTSDNCKESKSLLSKFTVFSIIHNIPQLPNIRECHSWEIIFPVFLTRLIRIKQHHLESNCIDQRLIKISQIDLPLSMKRLERFSTSDPGEVFIPFLCQPRSRGSNLPQSSLDCDVCLLAGRFSLLSLRLVKLTPILSQQLADCVPALFTW